MKESPCGSNSPLQPSSPVCSKKKKRSNERIRALKGIGVSSLSKRLTAQTPLRFWHHCLRKQRQNRERDMQEAFTAKTEIIRKSRMVGNKKHVVELIYFRSSAFLGLDFYSFRVLRCLQQWGNSETWEVSETSWLLGGVFQPGHTMLSQGLVAERDEKGGQEQA